MVKAFGLKVILYFAVYSILFALGNSLLFKYVNTQIFDREDIRTVVIGDSGMLLLNEDDIKNSLNISQAEETYKVMYYKIKAINKIRPIENLVMPLSTSNVAILNDKILNGERNTFEHVKRLYPLTNPLNLLTDGTDLVAGLEVMTKHVLSVNLEYLKYLWGESDYTPIYNPQFAPLIKKSIKNPSKKARMKFDQYYAQHLVDARIKHVYYDDKDSTTAVSQTAIKYLEKIVNYCYYEKINVFLITMPLVSSYQKDTPQIYKDKVAELKAYYSRYEHIKLLDYRDYYSKNENSHFFTNSDHATRYGVSLISRDINKNIYKPTSQKTNTYQQR